MLAPCTKDVPYDIPDHSALRPRKSSRQLNWAAIVGITMIHVVSVLACLPGLYSTRALCALLLLHWACGGLGITLGVHRLLTHRSFTTYKFIEYLLAWLASLNWQDGPIKWVATHRLHHQHADEHLDPHSPAHGFVWSHVLWNFVRDPKWDSFRHYSRYAKELARDPVHVAIERCRYLSQLFVAAILYLWGGWPCVVWGMFVRLVIVYHSTWLINSASHTWGYRNFETGDHSRNLWWLALITYGEGWHNNHHAQPTSARHGLRWWELDCTWLTIRLLALTGLAWDIRLPSDQKRTGPH